MARIIGVSHQHLASFLFTVCVQLSMISATDLNIFYPDTWKTAWSGYLNGNNTHFGVMYFLLFTKFIELKK
jgi:hypothetical protein